MDILNIKEGLDSFSIYLYRLYSVTQTNLILRVIHDFSYINLVVPNYMTLKCEKNFQR